MANSPSFFISAKCRNTGEIYDIGSVFPAKSGHGWSLLMKPGTVVKVTTQYDRETKQIVQLPKPVYVDTESYWFNMHEPKNKTSDTEFQVRKTFNVPAAQSQDFSDLSF